MNIRCIQVTILNDIQNDQTGTQELEKQMIFFPF